MLAQQERSRNTDLLQILSHPSTRRLQFVRHRELMIQDIFTA